MREKIVAAFFLILVLGIPLFTVGEKIIYNMDDQIKYVISNDNTETDEAVLNRNAQVQMQEDKKNIEETENEGGINKIVEQAESFADDLILIENAVEIKNTVTAALSDDEYIDSDQVLAGKGGWLFYKRADDGTSLADYQGTSTFSDKTMEEIGESLKQQRDTFQEKGIRFVVMIIPNKEIVYEEYMPSTINRISEKTRCDKLYEYLTSNTDLEIVYPKSELMEAKQYNQLYYKYDTHWNKIGAHIGVQSLLMKLYGTHQDISKVEIIVDSENRSGDLASLINMTEKYCDDVEYSLDMSNYDPKQIVEDNIMIIGDSFSDAMMNDLEYYFGEVNQVGVWTFKMSMLDTYQPNVVVWECVERYADRLDWINLTE